MWNTVGLHRLRQNVYRVIRWNRWYSRVPFLWILLTTYKWSAISDRRCCVQRSVDNLFSRYLGAGEVTPGVLGDSRHHEVTSDMTTGFVALCAIYFPSVTGATYAVGILFFLPSPLCILSPFLSLFHSSCITVVYYGSKQGVALTGRNTTGPPSRAVPWWVTLHMRVLQMTDDDDRRQRPLLVFPFTPCVGGPVIMPK